MSRPWTVHAGRHLRISAKVVRGCLWGMDAVVRISICWPIEAGLVCIYVLPVSHEGNTQSYYMNDMNAIQIFSRYTTVLSVAFCIRIEIGFSVVSTGRSDLRMLLSPLNRRSESEHSDSYTVISQGFPGFLYFRHVSNGAQRKSTTKSKTCP